MRGCAHALQWPSWSFTHWYPLWVKMTSSTKPEVRIILHCRQRRTEPWPQPRVTCTENFVKFWHVVRICLVFEIPERTDRHTDTHRHAHRITSHHSRGRSKHWKQSRGVQNSFERSTGGGVGEWHHGSRPRLHLRRVCTCMCTLKRI